MVEETSMPSDGFFSIPVVNATDLQKMCDNQEDSAAPPSDEHRKNGKFAIGCPQHPNRGVQVTFEENDPGIVIFCSSCHEPVMAFPLEKEKPGTHVRVHGKLPFYMLGKEGLKLDNMLKAVNKMLQDQKQSGDMPQAIKDFIQAASETSDTFVISNESKNEKDTKPRWDAEDNKN